MESFSSQASSDEKETKGKSTKKWPKTAKNSEHWRGVICGLLQFECSGATMGTQDCELMYSKYMKLLTPRCVFESIKYENMAVYAFLKASWTVIWPLECSGVQAPSIVAINNDEQVSPP